MVETKTCLGCSKDFTARPNEHRSDFLKRNFCKHECSSTYRRSAILNKVRALHEKSSTIDDLAENLNVRVTTAASYLRRAKLPWLPYKNGAYYTWESKIVAWMKINGLHPTKPEGQSPYDFLIADKRIEVKQSTFSTRQCWTFNIHRHNVLDESQVDFYILRLDKVPGFKSAIHLVIPSPIRAKTIGITMRSLLTKWGQYYNRLDLIDPTAVTYYSSHKL